MNTRVPAKPLQPARPEHHQPRTLREAYLEFHLPDATLHWRGGDGVGLELGSEAEGFGTASGREMTRVFGS